MAEGGSNDNGDDDVADGCDGKRKVGSGDKADGDGGDDDNNGGVVDNDADGGGGGKGNGDGRVDGNDVFDTKGDDEVDDGDDQIKSVASDLTECNRSLKMEIRLGLWR